jgi:hypothetical protein
LERACTTSTSRCFTPPDRVGFALVTNVQKGRSWRPFRTLGPNPGYGQYLRQVSIGSLAVTFFEAVRVLFSRVSRTVTENVFDVRFPPAVAVIDGVVAPLLQR